MKIEYLLTKLLNRPRIRTVKILKNIRIENFQIWVQNHITKKSQKNHKEIHVFSQNLNIRIVESLEDTRQYSKWNSFQQSC